MSVISDPICLQLKNIISYIVSCGIKRKANQMKRSTNLFKSVSISLNYTCSIPSIGSCAYWT